MIISFRIQLFYNVFLGHPKKFKIRVSKYTKEIKLKFFVKQTGFTNQMLSFIINKDNSDFFMLSLVSHQTMILKQTSIWQRGAL